MTVRISKDATLYLLPDPVTCFKRASCNQLQTFHLEDGASFVVLDSLTSGRKSLREEREGDREVPHAADGFSCAEVLA